MKVQTISAVAAATIALTGTQAAYEQPLAAPVNAYYPNVANVNTYFPNAALYGQQPVYGSPYPYGDAYSEYGKYENFEPVVVPQKEKPSPYVKYPKEDKDVFALPKLGEYHCFLTGAPWTSCGRRSLTSYFLDQCMVMYYSMSANVDGLCGVQPEAATDKGYGWEFEYAEVQHSDYYTEAPAQYGEPAPAEQYPEETPAPVVEESHGYGDLSEYQQEKCLQRSYIDITTAVVMCLTENMIRMKFIEHYANDAAKNPIEGPTLYLRKMHEFIENVLECHPEHDFPNLWLQYGNTYNPNSPYHIGSDGNVQMSQWTDGEASGLNDFRVNDHFLCANQEDLGSPFDFTYSTDASVPHYDSSMFDYCDARSAEVLGSHTINYETVHRAVKVCKYVQPAYPNSYGPVGVGKYMTTMDLRGLYDAVNPVTRRRMSTHRARSIAEVAVQQAGVLDQPILEGAGIMYFCGFYACKANNGGNLDLCFPEFDCDNDWDIPNGAASIAEFNELTEKVNACLAHKWIVHQDIVESGEVDDFFKALNSRSYLCMAESSVVDFFVTLYSSYITINTEEAWDLVYFRHLAVETCYGESTCVSNLDLYGLLYTALSGLVDQCGINRDLYHSKKQAYDAYEAQRFQGFYYPGVNSPAL